MRHLHPVNGIIHVCPFFRRWPTPFRDHRCVSSPAQATARNAVRASGSRRERRLDEFDDAFGGRFQQPCSPPPWPVSQSSRWSQSLAKFQSRRTVFSETLQYFRDLPRFQTAEEFEFHDLALARVRAAKLERAVERDEVHAARRARPGRPLRPGKPSPRRRRAWRPDGRGRDRRGCAASPARRCRKSARGSATKRASGPPCAGTLRG